MSLIKQKIVACTILILLMQISLLSLYHSNDIPKYSVDNLVEHPIRLMNREKHSLCMDLLGELLAVLSELDIKNYYLTSGSLLGSIRIGDILPNDDDIDISIHSSDVLSLYNKISYNNYPITIIKFRTFYKVFFKNQPPIKSTSGKNLTFSHPFIDLFLYDNYQEYSKLMHMLSPLNVIILRSYVFPLRKFMFGAHVVNIPNDPFEVLKFLGYNYAECITMKHSHTYINVGMTNFNCSLLRKIGPYIDYNRDCYVIKNRCYHIDIPFDKSGIINA